MVYTVRNRRTGATKPVRVVMSDVANALGVFPDGVSTSAVMSADPCDIIDMASGAAATVVHVEVYIGGTSTGILLPFAAIGNAVVGRPVNPSCPITLPGGQSIAFVQRA